MGSQTTPLPASVRRAIRDSQSRVAPVATAALAFMSGMSAIAILALT
ncbi:MAG: hypothetical protein ACU0DW_12855 [Shimia sp.]